MKKGKKSGLGMKDLMSLTMMGELSTDGDRLPESATEINELKTRIKAYEKELKAIKNKKKSKPVNKAASLDLNFDKIYQAALKGIREERFLEALKGLSLINYFEPNNIKVLNNLGVVYYELGFDQEARSNFKSALKIDPENKIAEENLKAIER